MARGLFGAIAAGVERKGVDISALSWSSLLGEDARVKSGVSVTTDSALRVAVFFACARVIAEDTAQLPLKVFRETADGDKNPAKDHSLYELLHDQPNAWQSAYEFVELLTLYAAVCGDALAFINRVGGQVGELIPLLPGSVRVTRGDDYRLAYEMRGPAGRWVSVPATDMLHLRGLGWSGYTGFDVVQQAREALGLAIATEETHARLFANGAQPGGILSVEGNLGPDAKASLIESWKTFQVGLGNRFKTAVLDQAAKWQPLAMTGVDSQHLDTRRFQIEEVCRGMRVFPLMVMHADKTATYAASESFLTAHYRHSIGPWLKRWQGALRRDLVSQADRRDGITAEFVVEAIDHADLKSKADFIQKMVVAAGVMTRNEARRKLNMNALPGLDEPLVPQNMATVDEDGDVTPVSDPDPAAPAAAGDGQGDGE